MAPRTTAFFLGFTAIHGAHAWGSLGHETVAFVAQNYVQDSTASWAQNILGSSSSSYLASVATWADSYRYTTAGKFSAPYHFIDAQDSPPQSCNVDYERDCAGSGCVVSAIANYTQRVQETGSLSSTEVQMALKWIIHFVGDITQPLHDENYAVGGNDIDVTFNGESRNLHSSWDTYIPEQLIGGYSLSDAQSWANDLVNDIDSGKYSSQKDSWVDGLDVTDPVTTAMGWATDANAFVCSTVAPDGWDAVSGTELYPTYYNSVIDTVELQIAKAGYRLAKWLDAIAAEAGSSKMIRRNLSPAELDGSELLPKKRELTPAQRRRAAVADGGCGCERHAH